MRRSLFLAFLFATSCTSKDQSGICKSDADCDAGFVCQTETGTCRCNTDDACGPGKYCNTFGACQDRPPCLGNDDCAEGEICNSFDRSGGACIPATSCGSSVHCELDHYCAKVAGTDPPQYTCKPGCRSHGDCELGKVCIGGTCTDAGSSSDCSLCPTTPDPDPNYCDYGELCSNTGECTTHPKKSALCQSCDDMTPCTDDTVCMVDNEQAGAYYCSALCNVDSDCPSGFDSCGGIAIVVKRCSSDADCGAAKCLGSAEAASAYCGCASQADCDIYSASAIGFELCQKFGGQGSCWPDSAPCNTSSDCACDTSSGTCIGTGLPCTGPSDCSLTCVQYQVGDVTVGSCETTKKVCGKTSGLTCAEFKSGDAPCRSVY